MITNTKKTPKSSNRKTIYFDFNKKWHPLHTRRKDENEGKHVHE